MIGLIVRSKSQTEVCATTTYKNAGDLLQVAFEVNLGNQRRTAPASLTLVVANASASCSILLLRGGGLRLRRLLPITPIEPVHAAGGIDQFLLAGKEGMTGGADFYADVASVRRAGNKGVTAGAMHAHFVVSGMNSWFHMGSNLDPNH